MKTPYYRETGFVGLCDAVPCFMPFAGYVFRVQGAGTHLLGLLFFSWTVERLILHGGCSLMLLLLGAIELPSHRFPSLLFYFKRRERGYKEIIHSYGRYTGNLCDIKKKKRT